MKWIILFLLAGFSSCAQKSNENRTAEGPEIFHSKFVSLVPDTNRMMLVENVVINYGDLYAEADSVLLDKIKKMVIVYGLKKGTFKGKEIKRNDISSPLVYQKGDEKFDMK